MGICIETTSTKDLKKLAKIIEDEISKRNARKEQCEVEIANLIYDVRRELNCTISISTPFNLFKIKPDTPFLIKIEDEEDE